MRYDSFQKKATGLIPVAQGLIIVYIIITAAFVATLFLTKPITRFAAKMAHELRQIAFRGGNKKMKVIGYKHVSQKRNIVVC
jgi:hypothetical protein